MITQQHAQKIARFIVDTRIAIAAQGDLATIDNYLTGGIELAHMVTSGYIDQLSASGELRLTTTYDRIKALREAVSRPIGMTRPVIECETPDGVRLVLMRTGEEGDRPVAIGDAVSEDHWEDGERPARFIVTGATWRDDVNETAPCMVGRWANYSPGESFPMTANGFQVYWQHQP